MIKKFFNWLLGLVIVAFLAWVIGGTLYNSVRIIKLEKELAWVIGDTLDNRVRIIELEKEQKQMQEVIKSLARQRFF
jgi:hypothetical protein